MFRQHDRLQLVSATTPPPTGHSDELDVTTYLLWNWTVRFLDVPRGRCATPDYGGRMALRYLPRISTGFEPPKFYALCMPPWFSVGLFLPTPHPYPPHRPPSWAL